MEAKHSYTNLTLPSQLIESNLIKKIFTGPCKAIDEPSKILRLKRSVDAFIQNLQSLGKHDNFFENIFDNLLLYLLVR